ncbi:dihydrofolate reductase family protein [Streptomyces sp. NPDC059442]|uniref:dihydrofolate reductase family protein n=1 Tax=Streptomyces sp. NPDC059442 TaxID=3346830 RepID=UPI0036A73395
MARQIILWMGVSLDGYIEGPDRDISWHRVDEELHQHMNDELGVMGGFLAGRVTHELMAEYWPTAGADPASSPIEVEFAAIWRDMPKTVYSRTLQRADWNTTIVRQVDADEVRALKEQPGGDLALSGADLAAAFMEQDLVDGYRIYVHPVLIGRGKPLFPTTDVVTGLRLAESRTFGNGVVLLRYERDRG